MYPNPMLFNISSFSASCITNNIQTSEARFNLSGGIKKQPNVDTILFIWDRKNYFHWVCLEIHLVFHKQAFQDHEITDKGVRGEVNVKLKYWAGTLSSQGISQGSI